MSHHDRTRLDDEQVGQALSGLSGWALKDGQIEKTYGFDCYQKGLVFAVTVGYLADQMDHHPDLSVGYRKVTIGLSTHDVGGISALDFALARKIESAAGDQ
jgi:4a-hydroxytetrahydrobiopterin dehydratase